MTFRQVLAIIWRRRILVAVTTLLVIAAALVYARLAPVTYESTVLLRYSPAGTATLNGSNAYGSANLDLDPDFATTPTITTIAAKALNEDPAVVQAAASSTPDTAQSLRTLKLAISAVGSTPDQAKNRANAVADAFVAHLNSQVADHVDDLKGQLEQQQKINSRAQATLRKNPGDTVASNSYSVSNSQIAQLQSEIATINGNGNPLNIQQRAALGTRQGVSLLTIILIGITSGLLAGAGAALIRDQFDDHARSTEDIEEIIGDHVMGDIALVPRRQMTLTPLPAASRLPTPLNESVRSLRTSLEVVFPQRHVSLVVTSAEPGEGKTFVSANLAVSMARAGRSVILVEADLRRPRVGAYFDLPEGGTGFGELVEGDASAEEITAALITTPYLGLRILTAGASRAEPADLLAGDTLKGVMQRLRGLADFVLLDSPPGLALADAAILGREADAVLVVTALNRTRGSALRGTLQSLSANRVEVVGVVVNRSRRATVRSYAQYYRSQTTADANDDGPTPASAPDSAIDDARLNPSEQPGSEAAQDTVVSADSQPVSEGDQGQPDVPDADREWGPGEPAAATDQDVTSADGADHSVNGRRVKAEGSAVMLEPADADEGDELDDSVIETAERGTGS